MKLNRGGEILSEDRIYLYYKFDPLKVTGVILNRLESDTNKIILKSPFADGNIYFDELNPNINQNIDPIGDNMLYIVFKKSSPIKTIFEGEYPINAVKMDELYLPQVSDENLQIQAILTSGFSNEPNIATFKLNRPCLFKRPEGKIEYYDIETRINKPVPEIQVWALAFGIQIKTYTNYNGDYSIPWLFSRGTFMGTHAKNSTVNIKPLNSIGTIVGSILSIATNFVEGSIHHMYWKSSCDMRYKINVSFNWHGQARYWAQLLDALKLHRAFCAQDNIASAPNSLTIYAEWANQDDSCSAPMLGKIGNNPQLLSFMSNYLFGTNLPVTAAVLYNLFSGAKPDLTFKFSATENLHYSEDLMQTAFHELAHASLFQKVGQSFWIRVIERTVDQGGYGSENSGSYGGETQLNESWAEFIGKLHHQRIHPNGQADVIKSGNTFNTWESYPLALEQVPYFYNSWLNCGIYYDLLDNTNESTNETLSGYSVQYMYNCFTPTSQGFCDWRTTFLTNTSGVSLVTINKLMKIQNNWSGICLNQ